VRAAPGRARRGLVREPSLALARPAVVAVWRADGKKIGHA
jgi:hypothetical protein